MWTTAPALQPPLLLLLLPHLLLLQLLLGEAVASTAPQHSSPPESWWTALEIPVPHPPWPRPLPTVSHLPDYEHDAVGGSAADLDYPEYLVSSQNLVRPVETLGSGDVVGDEDWEGSGDAVSTGDLVIPGDLVNSGDLLSTGSMANTGNLLHPGDLVISGDLVSRKDLVNTDDLIIQGDLVRPGDLVSTEGLNTGRTKRKVISSGGHYIVWSRSGTSPWSSTGYESVGEYKINNNREHGWTSRGKIGDGGSRRTTYTAPTQQPKIERRKSRKKLTKSFKREIAQYAMVYGAKKAALHYEQTIGRRLRDRVVNKFVQRYQERRKRKRRRLRRRLSGQT
ncbi:uncharacterized protein LOC121867972 [Homarus americanus]|uniref:uncharacterized protein LOC121867972 n=1 Tax=Homarus americanus TaxID=6706 RepID=UPI001C4928EA|nr:uncharacterized protein LOC121867972 [Homarus americanus]